MDAVALARCFGLTGPARLSEQPVARGKQGAVWRLDTPDGRWAVKVPFVQVSEDDVRLATQFQEAARLAGVPTPLVRRTVDGRVFATVQGTRARLYEWVDLLTADPLVDPEQVGAVVAAMHLVAGPFDASVDPWHCEPVGAGRWDQLVEQLTRAGAPFARRLADLRDELVALETWIEPPGQVRICHCDLWADNLLPTAGGGLCVIDWENSGPADPCHELGCVVFEFARTDPGRVRALLSAYRDAGGPARFSRRGHFTMLIAQLGHISEIAATDWLEPNVRSPERAGSAAWISEVLDEPHTREVLAGLLAAGLDV